MVRENRAPRHNTQQLVDGTKAHKQAVQPAAVTLFLHAPEADMPVTVQVWQACIVQ